MYETLAERIPDAQFHFQIPHQKIAKRFKDDPQFRFYAWNEKPVETFLSDIDIYLINCRIGQ